MLKPQKRHHLPDSYSICKTILSTEAHFNDVFIYSRYAYVNIQHMLYFINTSGKYMIFNHCKYCRPMFNKVSSDVTLTKYEYAAESILCLI